MKFKAPVRRLTGTEFNYIKGKKFVIFSNNVTMSVAEFREFKENGTLAKKVMLFSKIPGRLYDWDIALKKEILQPVYLPVVIHKQRKPKKKKIIEAEVVVLPPKKKPVFIIPKDKKIIIFWVMLVTAAGSALMSIYHASVFLYQGGKPLIISFITGCLLVIFASTGFTASRYFWERKGFARIFSAPFLLITCVLIGYIAFSTTSVSYGQFRDEEAGTTKTTVAQIGKLELYREVQRQVTEQEKFVRGIPKWKTKSMSDETWNNYQIQLNKGTERLDELRNKAYKLKEEAGGGTIEQKQIAITSVYEFLEEIFGLNSRVLRFIVYVIPAVFYDIVAPFGFTIVFFLLDSKKEQGE